MHIKVIISLKTWIGNRDRRMMYEDIRAFHTGEKDLELPDKTNSLVRKKASLLRRFTFFAGDLQR